MKKIVSIVMVMLIAAAMLTGCGGSGGSEGSGGSGGAVDSLKTFGDIEALGSEDYQCSQYPDDCMLIYAFKLGDGYYRASAKLTPETSAALWDLAYDDPDYEKKYKELMDTIEIEEIEDLTDQILSDDELAELAGKTGQELLDEGWTPNGSFFLDDMSFWMNYGPFIYAVYFDGDAGTAGTDAFDVEEGIKDWTAKGGKFVMLGDHASDL